MVGTITNKPTKKQVRDHKHTPSTMSSISLRAGPTGERKPELSTTQLDRLVSPEVESVSDPGLRVAFGGVKALDVPTSLAATLTC